MFHVCIKTIFLWDVYEKWNNVAVYDAPLIPSFHDSMSQPHSYWKDMIVIVC